MVPVRRLLLLFPTVHYFKNLFDIPENQWAAKIWNS